MSHVSILPIDFSLNEINLMVYPTILEEEKQLVLVDCGYPNSMTKLENEMNKKGFSLSQLTKIIITHHDYDHMGALREITDLYPSIEVLCSKEEAPYITGKRKSLRLLQAEAVQETLPENEQESGKLFQQFIASIKKADHVTKITIGDILPLCGGVEVVDTKGHMPGHISLYIRDEKTLIAGDALVVENGKLCIAMPGFVLNMQDAQDSIRHLLTYNIEKIICYHGGIYTTDIQKSLEEIVANF